MSSARKYHRLISILYACKMFVRTFHKHIPLNGIVKTQLVVIVALASVASAESALQSAMSYDLIKCVNYSKFILHSITSSHPPTENGYDQT